MGRQGRWKRGNAEDDAAPLRQRLFLLRLTILVAFCIGLVMSPGLWVGPRSYPQVPVWSLLPPIEGAVALALYGALFVLAGLAVIIPRPRWPIAGFLVIMIAFCLADQTRWQPWVFQYSFLLMVVGLGRGGSAAPAGDLQTLNLARLVIVFTYVFSGLQKINLNFMEHEFSWIITPITSLLPATTTPLDALGFLVPFIQVTFGVGLLTRRFRRASLAAAVGMHVFILAMFGPLGLNWNDIVWPWTAAMAVFDVLLFSGNDDFTWRDIVWNVRDFRHGAAVVLFVVLPALSFFNLWDSYLSSALYSGNLTEAQIYLSDLGAASTPGHVRPYLVHTSENTNVLNLQRWAIEDLNVTPYAETRVFKTIAGDLCHALSDRSQLVLVVKEQRLFFSRPEIGFRCSQL
ncbi:hypothetical protein ACFPFP_09780 [Bradyrhizobium sp. GCM10023182]|uniref:DoxX family protein n=1 Tax=Bradyrhizobium zhengyangense TaxID=2911009 RepID=A0ABS9LJX0_9BRAD|nr:hypothetical protein [Bradyrhizobium zhengyangense]MCG2667233.1 hypothetical protein [Bradyrhizobium zhengyangense]